MIQVIPDGWQAKDNPMKHYLFSVGCLGRITRGLRLASMPLLTLALSYLRAEESMWLQARPFQTAPGGTIQISYHSGGDFAPKVRPLHTNSVAALRQYSARGTVDLLNRVPAAPGADFLELSFAGAGSYLIEEVSKSKTIVSSPDEFRSYLEEAGLDEVAAARKAADQEKAPARERYSHFVKTLVSVGDKHDDSFAIRSGQPLEIVPQSDPLGAKAGDRISFQVLFNGNALANALVYAMRRGENQVLAIKTRTSARGIATFDLPYAGPWKISLTHMIPLKGVAEIDWESYWGSLTFELPAR